MPAAVTMEKKKLIDYDTIKNLIDFSKTGVPSIQHTEKWTVFRWNYEGDITHELVATVAEQIKKHKIEVRQQEGKMSKKATINLILQDVVSHNRYINSRSFAIFLPRR